MLATLSGSGMRGNPNDRAGVCLLLAGMQVRNLHPNHLVGQVKVPRFPPVC